MDTPAIRVRKMYIQALKKATGGHLPYGAGRRRSVVRRRSVRRSTRGGVLEGGRLPYGAGRRRSVARRRSVRRSTRGGVLEGGVRRRRRVTRRASSVGGRVRRRSVRRMSVARRGGRYVGGVKRRVVRRSGAGNSNPWIAHVRKVYNAHPNMSWGEAMHAAKSSY